MGVREGIVTKRIALQSVCTRGARVSPAGSVGAGRSPQETSTARLPSLVSGDLRRVALCRAYVSQRVTDVLPEVFGSNPFLKGFVGASGAKPLSGGLGQRPKVLPQGAPFAPVGPTQPPGF